MNVFEDQVFLLRRPPTPEHPLGEQVRRTYRELMTGPDEDLRFDYPLEYFNVAALGLCAALTQAAFEPEDAAEIADRMTAPMSPEEFDRGVESLRDAFGIDGLVRFMQGPEPGRDAKGRIEKLALLGDKVILTPYPFLNRPDDDWVVALDQIPLLLFSRSTFYEKSAGRGYLTGTSGDLEIRVFPIDRSSLRRSIWLNVLSRDVQERGYEGDFVPAGSGKGYDSWMWETPPRDDVPQGRISLRAGLFWMVAYNYVVIEEVDRPRPCMVTGRMTTGRAGTGVVTNATGIGYGVKVAREKGPEVRMSFFRHPNAPFYIGESKQGEAYTRHLSVDEVTGLFGNMAGLFYSQLTGEKRAAGQARVYRMAPVLGQLYGVRERADKPLETDLICFGFHMLSSKQNIHGGYEFEAFHYPLLGGETADEEVLNEAQAILSGAAEQATKVQSLLCRVVQLCMMVQINSEDKEGRLAFTYKENINDGGFASDIGRDFWSRLGGEVRELLKQVGDHGDSIEELQDVRATLDQWWLGRLAAHARDLFEPIFNDYSSSPQNFLAAHNARKIFFGSLRNLGVQFESAIPDSGVDANTDGTQPLVEAS